MEEPRETEIRVEGKMEQLKKEFIWGTNWSMRSNCRTEWMDEGIDGLAEISREIHRQTVVDGQDQHKLDRDSVVNFKSRSSGPDIVYHPQTDPCTLSQLLQPRLLP